MKNAFTWQTVSPEIQRLNSAKLDALGDALAARGTKSFLVIRNDRIVYEWYAPDHGPSQRHYTASLAKALVGGLSLVLAMDDRLISPDDLVCEFIPQWRDHPQKSKITIRHLATHTSGLEDAELSQSEREQILAEGRTVTEYHMDLPGWKGAFWRKEPDPFSISRDEAPIIFPPGSQYAYSNPGMAMLAYAVTASLINSPHPDIRTLLCERIMKPIGVEDDEWEIGYGRTYNVAGLPLVANWGGGIFTSRAVARVARLLLHYGEWEGQQLISPARVKEVLTYAGMPLPDRSTEGPYPGSGLGWYTNFDSVWQAVPPDAFAGAGAGNQILLVIPCLDMTVVRNGELLDPEQTFWGGLETHLFNPLMDALLIKPPYPPSAFIKSVSWAPASSVIRLATGSKTRDGSDNWPLTWADDDHLYTAYGDGFGFDPIVPYKLGLGFGVVLGNPESGISGLNIRSSAENSSYGKNGIKASGLLMVDGVLYMWVRNADNNGHHSQLAWSNDFTKTWTWCDWKFEEFGYIAMINFGKNYAGARDEYVYMVSPDNPNAYESADHFILARVHKDRITDRAAYEFFTGVVQNGASDWTGDISKRGAVFSAPGQCARSGISYDPGIERYLWWHQQPETGENREGTMRVDSRFEGGFAIYDAPEPWGPWTTVYFTEKWDVGPGETASFPTKWMSQDGKMLYLVFSGNDNFSVRKVTLTTDEGS